MILLEGSLPEIPFTVTVKLDGNKEFKFRFLPPPLTTTPMPDKPGSTQPAVPNVRPSCNKTTTPNTPVNDPTEQGQHDPHATGKVEDATILPGDTSEMPENVTTSGSCRLMSSLGILLMAALVMLFV